jgi:hypothetical protein
VAVYLAEVLNAPNAAFGWWNVAALVGGAAVALRAEYLRAVQEPA